MKYLYHEFSLKERIIICLLVISLFAVFYVYVIKIPLDNAMYQAVAQKEAQETEMMIVTNKVQRYEKMKSELENSSASYMPSYNASKEEITFLDSIFANTIEYGIKFNTVTREGDLVRRSFSFSFSVASQSQAKSILKQLINSKYRCLVTDIASVESRGMIVISGNATFYETLVDGTIDAALPPDTSVQQQPIVEEDLY